MDNELFMKELGDFLEHTRNIDKVSHDDFMAGIKLATYVALLNLKSVYNEADIRRLYQELPGLIGSQIQFSYESGDLRE